MENHIFLNLISSQHQKHMLEHMEKVLQMVQCHEQYINLFMVCTSFSYITFLRCFFRAGKLISLHCFLTGNALMFAKSLQLSAPTQHL